MNMEFWKYLRNDIAENIDECISIIKIILIFTSLTFIFAFLIKLFNLVGVIISLIIGVISGILLAEYIKFITIGK